MQEIFLNSALYCLNDSHSHKDDIKKNLFLVSLNLCFKTYNVVTDNKN